MDLRLVPTLALATPTDETALEPSDGGWTLRPSPSVRRALSGHLAIPQGELDRVWCATPDDAEQLLSRALDGPVTIRRRLSATAEGRTVAWLERVDGRWRVEFVEAIATLSGLSSLAAALASVERAIVPSAAHDTVSA